MGARENDLGSEHLLEEQEPQGSKTESQEDYPTPVSDGPHSMMIVNVAVAWAVLIIEMVVTYFVYRPKSKKATELWEFSAFAHMYFNLGGLIAVFLPQKIESVTAVNWLANGGVGGAISLLLSSIFCVIYAKLVKVTYGSDPSNRTWLAIRLIYLGIVMVIGFITGGVTIYIAMNTQFNAGNNWLWAVGVVAAIYLMVILPVVAIAVFVFGANTYPVEEEKPGLRNLKDGAGSSKLGSGDGHVRSILEGGLKTEPKRLRRTSGPCMTGRAYYDYLTRPIGTGEVKSIPMYGEGAPRAGGGGGGSKALASAPPSPTPVPQSPVRKTSSQISTGTGYYAELMAKEDAPRVKSISQYGGALLGSGPK